MQQHDWLTETTRKPAQGHRPSHQARCRGCGWVGPVRPTFQDSRADGRRHVAGIAHDSAALPSRTPRGPRD